MIAGMDGALEDVVGYVDRWIGYRQRTIHLPGVAYAIARRGKVLATGAHGVTNVDTGTPLTPEHVFRIASQSKMFTATAVMLLAEAGRLRLDDPVATHVPNLPAALATVTARELASHGAGVIRDGEHTPFWELSGDFPDAGALTTTLRGGRVLARNERYKYSNVGFALLGRLVEAATGTSYAEHLRAAVLRPLGLASTSTDLADADRERLADGHSSGRGGAVRRPLPHAPTGAFAAATGFCSTVGDIAAFGAAHCYGAGALLTDDGRRVLHQPQWPVPREKDQHYALGFTVADIDGHRYVGHGGAYPGFITSTRIDAARGLVFAVMTNSIDGPAAELANGLARLVNLALEPDDGDTSGADRPMLDRFTGRFTGLWSTLDLVRLGRRLVAFDPAAPDPVERVVRLRVEDDSTALIADVPGSGPYAERVRLQTEPSGRVTGLRWAGLPMARED